MGRSRDLDPEDPNNIPAVGPIALPGEEVKVIAAADVDTTGAEGRISDESAAKLEALQSTDYQDPSKLSTREKLQANRAAALRKAEAEGRL